MLAHSLLIESSAKLLVTRIGIKVWANWISGLWFPWSIYVCFFLNEIDLGTLDSGERSLPFELLILYILSISWCLGKAKMQRLPQPNTHFTRGIRRTGVSCGLACFCFVKPCNLTYGSVEIVEYFHRPRKISKSVRFGEREVTGSIPGRDIPKSLLLAWHSNYGIELDRWSTECQDNVWYHFKCLGLWGSTIKLSIKFPVATRHRRDMTEKLLKATLNPNKQQQQYFLVH